MLDYFVFVITSEATKGRKPVMQSQLSAAGMVATYVETLSVNFAQFHSTLTDGEVDCFLKHMVAYDRLLASRHDFALVLEDDAIFEQNFPQQLNEQIPVIQFDLFFISDDFFAKPHQVISEHIIKTNGSKTTCAYLIGRRAAEIMLRHAKEADKPIDHKMNDIIEAYRLETYWHTGLVRHGTSHHIYPTGMKHT